MCWQEDGGMSCLRLLGLMSLPLRILNFACHHTLYYMPLFNLICLGVNFTFICGSTTFRSNFHNQLCSRPIQLTQSTYALYQSCHAAHSFCDTIFSKFLSHTGSSTSGGTLSPRTLTHDHPLAPPLFGQFTMLLDLHLNNSAVRLS